MSEDTAEGEDGRVVRPPFPAPPPPAPPVIDARLARNLLMLLTPIVQQAQATLEAAQMLHRIAEQQDRPDG